MLSYFEKKPLKSPLLLDCTLRDGSYEVDFQFDHDFTKLYCEKINHAGVKMVEVGHGVGLGASRKQIGIAKETDESYMLAASEGLNAGYWGMFCIPGIAELADIKIAADYGMNFIRLGVDINNVHQLKDYIKIARDLGLFVFTNFMKSYASSPDEFLQASLHAQSYGAQGIYVVDSAGGMLPNELKGFLDIIKDPKLDNMITGFHGHNNIGLAVSNTLYAIDQGVQIVDVSVRGLGRSSGNASFEQVLACMARMGIVSDIDIIDVMTIGDEMVSKFLRHDRNSSLDVTAGLALFHSSYYPVIKSFSDKYGVDPRKLILSLCEIDKLNAPHDLVEKIAKKLAKEGSLGSWKKQFRNYDVNEQGIKI